MTIKAKKSKINLREKLVELLNFRQIRDRLDGLGLYLGKDRTGTAENLAVRGGANVDDLQLAEISAILGDDAVDVFVYDTSKDSDGGKWRERTQHTSWYNEELNTATRGSRREFPAVAVIISEGNRVTIYDGDDSDLSMWMVFNASSGNWLWYGSTGKASVMLNGKLANCAQSNARTRTIDFISDSHREYSHTDGQGSFSGGIIQRNSGSNTLSYDNGTIGLVDRTCNDVAMTVLPNAPIDDNTGLPVPTIAVATDGGVSVIKDDGSVVDIVSDVLTTETPFEVNFRGRLLYILLVSPENVSNLWNSVSTIYIPDNDVSTTYRHAGDYVAQYFRYNGLPASEPLNSGHDMLVPINSQTHLPLNQRSGAINVLGTDHLYIGGEGSEDKAGGVATIYENLTNPKNGLLAYTTSSYNTGWMPGDIKLATLSDNTVETVGVHEGEEVFVDSNGNWIGDFDQSSDLNGWGFIGPGEATIQDGRVRVDNTDDAGSLYFRSPEISVEPGKTYKFSFYYLGDGVNRITVYIHSTNGYGSDQAYQECFGEGFHTIIFTPNVSSIWIKLSAYDTNPSAGRYHTYDSVSIKEYSGELVVNGQFADGTAGWILSSSNTPTVSSSGALQFNNVDGSAQSHAEQEIPTIAGEKYLLSFDYAGSSTLNIYIGTSQGGSQILNTSISSSDGYLFSFVATSSSTWIRFRDNVSGTTPTIDNVSIRLAEDDRSVNDNGLQVFGEIDKTPVAPGADLVAYSGFSADNYLMRPYNSDLNFGTGDFCYHFWEKHSSNGWIVDYDRPSTHGHILIGAFGDEMMRFEIGDNTNGDVVSPHNVWNCYTFIRRNNTCYVFHNGEQKTSFGDDGANIDASSRGGVLYLGGAISVSATAFTTGSIALFRVSATAPTDEQIAKIYRDEKALFTDGAQATLYGTSDAVTALAYDDKTELLHVGTSGGRSDFAGLRRINNTTTAVTTSISASNNLIAEQ